MTCKRTVFPFTAIVGQQRMKKSLILNAINPNLGGVLIRGEKGTAKSTAVRGLADLLPEIEVVEGCPFSCNPHRIQEMCFNCRERVERGEKLSIVKRKMVVVDLPLGATEDRIVGTIDIEQAIKKGKKNFEPGLMAKANRGIFYVDEVNLLDDHLVDILLDAAAMGVNIVEREGVSYSHPAKFILVGTMNPEEGELRPQLLDRFGLCVEIHGLNDPGQREEIIKRCVEYEKHPHEFEKKWEDEQNKLRRAIVDAQKIFPHVLYSDEILKLITRISIDMGVDGHRADIAMIKTAKTIAAYHKRKEVLEEDVKEAAELVLPHRMKKKPFQQPEVHPEQIEQSIKKHKEENQQHKHSRQQPSDADKGKKNDTEQKKSDASTETRFRTGDPFSVRRISPGRDKISRLGSGRRSNAKSDSKTGRYVRSTIPNNKANDIALDATIRAAAPYQPHRKKQGMAIAIESWDIRQKVKEKKVGNTIMFVVDSSGSMGANQRMVETKGAILSFLIDAYQKRDKVGMVAFKGNRAEVLLFPTSSVELAKRHLEELPTGGKTPLSKGLLKGFEVLQNELRKKQKVKPLLVLISDGKANVSMGEGSPFEEIRDVAENIKKSGIKSIVIDTESGFITLGKTREIAESMGAAYYKIDDLKADKIREAVSHEINEEVSVPKRHR